MNDISTLHSALFETLQALQDKDNPMDLDRAKVIGEVGQVIINAARAEIDFAKVNGSVDSQFFHKPQLTGQPPMIPAQKASEQEGQVIDGESITSTSSTGGTINVNHQNGQRIVTHVNT